MFVLFPLLQHATPTRKSSKYSHAWEECHHTFHIVVAASHTEIFAFPSPPSFKGRRWGNAFSLSFLTPHNRNVVKSMYNFIANLMVPFICFHCNVGGCCAAQFLHLAFFFFFFRRLIYPSCRSLSPTGRKLFLRKSAALTLQHYDMNKWMIP